MKPAGQMILCEKLLDSMTRGGLHIPQQARDSPDTAKVYRMRVIAFGPGIAHNPGAPPVRIRPQTIGEYAQDPVGSLERLTCQEIVGQDFGIGDVLLCSRYNYNCDFDGMAERNADGSWKEFRMVRAEDVLGVEAGNGA